MPTGPQKIVMINAGKYDFAEVDLDGTLQIVGPNNTGKTTLINTLQFLYINDQREMDFGSYTKEQTRDFYFRSQYSYVLFECLSTQGQCVMGWRGQSKASGNEPERFVYRGPFDRDDFFDSKGQIREPRDVNARLALRQYEPIKSQQQHRELLLHPTAADSPGLGIISLRDPDKYHHFRETLKNLLSLSSITQDEMRARLLMLADIPAEAVALDARQLFGEDYDVIRRRREALVRFKTYASAVGALVKEFEQREALRGELAARWQDLRPMSQKFETVHQDQVKQLKVTLQEAENRSHALVAERRDRLEEQTQHAEVRGGIKQRLTDLMKRGVEFDQFIEELERAALAELRRETSRLERLISEGATESREKAQQKVAFFTDQVRQKEGLIANFDQLVVTELRRHYSDAQLDQVFQLLNFQLLERPLGKEGLVIRDAQGVAKLFKTLLGRISPEGYQDETVSIRLRGGSRSVSDFADLSPMRERLREDQEALARWTGILRSITERESLQQTLREKMEALEQKNRLLFRWEEWQKAKAESPRLDAELRKIEGILSYVHTGLARLDKQLAESQDQQRSTQEGIVKAENEFNAVMGRFKLCQFPDFSTAHRRVDCDFPEEFDAAVGMFLRLQDRHETTAGAVAARLRDVEHHLGEEYLGIDEQETLQILQSELEALPEKEEVLARDWNAHLHGLKGAFDQVLKELSEVKSAADQLNRQFARVQVSNLKAIRIEAMEQSDVMSWIRRLADMEQPSLFDQDTQLEPALRNFRLKLEGNPLIHYSQLFTLKFTVVGDDDVARHYQDFKQIESHGTTITIKVLFNLLVLKSLLRKDDCIVPFFLDEIQALDPANRHAILITARKLGFVAITAAPESVTEVDALYFLQPHKGRVVLKHKHRLGVRLTAAP